MAALIDATTGYNVITDYGSDDLENPFSGSAGPGAATGPQPYDDFFENNSGEDFLDSGSSLENPFSRTQPEAVVNEVLSTRNVYIKSFDQDETAPRIGFSTGFAHLFALILTWIVGLYGSLSFSGSGTKTGAKQVIASITLSGILVPRYAIGKLLSGVLSFTGSLLSHQFFRFNQALSSTLSFIVDTLFQKRQIEDTFPNSYSEGAAETLGVDFSGLTAVGQSFTASFTGTLAASSFYLERAGTLTGNVYSKLYSHTGTYGVDSIPGTLLATSNPVLASTISNAGYTDVEFTFSGSQQVALTNGSYYVIVLEYTESVGPTKYIAVGGDWTSPIHSGNESYYYTGPDWFSRNDSDLVFTVYGWPSLLFQIFTASLSFAGNVANKAYKTFAAAVDFVVNYIVTPPYTFAELFSGALSFSGTVTRSWGMFWANIGVRVQSAFQNIFGGFIISSRRMNGYDTDLTVTTTPYSFPVGEQHTVFIKNKDASNYVEVDSANTFDEFPQLIPPKKGIYLTTSSAGTIYVRSTTGLADVQIISDS